jgi:hypothetical protein
MRAKRRMARRGRKPWFVCEGYGRDWRLGNRGTRIVVDRFSVNPGRVTAILARRHNCDPISDNLKLSWGGLDGFYEAW